MTYQEMEEFVAAVRLMRVWQRKWFVGDKSQPILIACRQAEAKEAGQGELPL